MRTPVSSGSDVGILRITDDNAYICNSSDEGYAFAVWDTDKTKDFRGTNIDNASFVVLSDYSGAKVCGNEVIHSGNIGSQSVNYATSAGSAPASDVYSWAKQSSKPSYTKSEIGLGNVDNTADSQKSVNYATRAGNADTVDDLHASNLVRFFLSPMASDASADSAKSWFTDTMPSASGAIRYNTPGSEKTIIAGKSSGAYGHMLQLNYDDNYLRLLRYQGGSWKTTDWEKISAGYADSAGSAPASDVYSWAKASSKPSYSYSEISGRPTKLSDLSNDVGYITSH
jgi:hypothetical protein